MAEGDFSAGQPVPQGERAPWLPKWQAQLVPDSLQLQGSEGWGLPGHRAFLWCLDHIPNHQWHCCLGGWLKGSLSLGLREGLCLHPWERAFCWSASLPIEGSKTPCLRSFPHSAGLTAGGRCLMEASLGLCPGTFHLKPPSFPLLIAQVKCGKNKGRCWFLLAGMVRGWPHGCLISHT